MKRPEAIRQQLALWGLVFGLWCLLLVGFAGQLVFTAAVPWRQAFRLALRDWLPWAILAPITVWLAFRFPLERGRLQLSIPIHVVACILAVLACEFIARQAAPVFRPLPARLQPGFRGGRGAGPPFGPGPNRPLPETPQQPLRPGELPEPRRPLFSAMRAKFNIPIYWIIVSIVHTLTFYRRSHERERRALELESSLASARLQALRMQLHPHFLFNTLNAIATLVHKDPQAADEMITNLGELLRATLDTSDQEIPLRRELDFLARYLEIQQVRFGDRLRVEKKIDAAALDGLVPTLILQPLVENAVRHGIEPQTGAGLVQIRAQHSGEVLRLTVHDSGAGPKQHAQAQEGIGLANTNGRLQALYGERARLMFTSESEGGFSVELEIPFHESPWSNSNTPLPSA